MVSSEKVTSEEDSGVAIQLLSLSACQGLHSSCLELGHFYLRRSKNCREMSKDKRFVEHDVRKDLLLALYWYGKAAEAEGDEDPKGSSSLVLDFVMVHIWYPNINGRTDPLLPGHSHIPFYTWAKAKGGQHAKEFSLSNPWKSKCATCDQPSSEKQ